MTANWNAKIKKARMARKWAIIDNVKDILRETEPPKSVAASLGKSILREGERERDDNREADSGGWWVMADFSPREANMLGDSEQEFSDVTLKLCYLDGEYLKELKKRGWNRSFQRRICARQSTRDYFLGGWCYVVMSWM